MPLGTIDILAYNIPSFIKDASFFGALFIDLKIILANVGLFYFIKRKFLDATTIMLPILLIAFIPQGKPNQSFKTSLAIVQANIPQNEKWKDSLLSENLKKYLKLSQGLKSKIVIWPESAYPYLFSKKTAVNIKQLLQNNNFSLIFGALTEKQEKYYNSVVFYSKSSFSIYNKRKLVPFAEFIPLAKPLGLEAYNFARGNKGVIFKLDNLRMAPLICYEENFSELGREYKIEGANLLVVLTNDAWFDKTPTFYLFPRSDIYRALENRIWVVRAANTGLSFIVDPYGKIIKKLKPDTMDVLRANLAITVFPLTFFDKFGWLFGYLMVILAILLPFCKKCKNRKS